MIDLTGLPEQVAPAPPRVRTAPTGTEPGIRWNGREGEISTEPHEEGESPKSWDDLLVDWGLDPAEVEVVPGSVEIRAWDANMGRDPNSGEVCTKRLRYYKARLQRRTFNGTTVDYDGLVDEIRKWKPAKRTPPSGDLTLLVNLADWQIGSADGRGTEAIIARVLDMIGEVCTYVTSLRKMGYSIGRMHVQGLGDLYEGCFAAGTVVQTKEGLRRIEELAAQGSAVVKTNYGKWVTAPFRSFGVQPIVNLTLERSGATQVIRTTANHRWMVHNNPSANSGFRDVLTSDLQIGDMLKPVFGGAGNLVEPSPFGIARGLVFGDGHRVDKRTRSQGSAINLYRGDWWALPYFEGCRKSEPTPRKFRETDRLRATENSDCIVIRDCPSYFKDRPSLDESPSYLLGWLAGYFAADGTVGTTIRLDCAQKEELEFVGGVCARLGIGTQPIKKSMRKGCGDVETPIYRLTMIRSTVPRNMMVHPEKLAAFDALPPQSPPGSYTFQKNKARCWRVIGVEDAGVSEEVFCAEVPKTHTFALNHDILTGNCTGHYAMQEFSVQLDRRQQTRVIRRLLKTALTTWASRVEIITVGTVPGNHGEHRKDGKAFTTFGDNDDVAVFESVAEMFQENPDLRERVMFTIPDQDMVQVFDLSGTIVAFAHAHQATRNSNGGKLPPAQAKVLTWWKDQSFGLQRPGDADLLVTGHYHHFSIIEHGHRTHLQCPAMDDGSIWFTNQSGLHSRAGTLAMLVGSAMGAGGYGATEILGSGTRLAS